MIKDPNSSATPEWPMHIDTDKSQDLFIQCDGYDFAGTHILLDCWDAKNLDNLEHIESTLRTAVEVSGATLLHIHLHHFTPNGGVSGVGKSTLVDILMGLLIPDSGKMYVDNNEITSELLHSWRSLIAYVPQETYLFDGSIRSNMQWITDKSFDDEEIWLALDTASAGNFVRKLPEQLGTLVGERGVKLSGGERQRIALARALLKIT